jgi:hypothetical protein
MFDTFKSRLLMTAAAVAMGTAVFAAPIGVASVDVEADVSVVENQTALTQWPTLAEDLRAAIAEEVFPETSPEGLEVSVRITSLSLDGSYVLGDDGRFNTMEGVVVVKRPDEPQSAEGMQIRLMSTSDTTITSSADVFVIPPSPEDFYNAMILAFANSVGEKVKDFDK